PWSTPGPVSVHVASLMVPDGVPGQTAASQVAGTATEIARSAVLMVRQVVESGIGTRCVSTAVSASSVASGEAGDAQGTHFCTAALGAAGGAVRWPATPEGRRATVGLRAVDTPRLHDVANSTVAAIDNRNARRRYRVLVTCCPSNTTTKARDQKFP